MDGFGLMKISKHIYGQLWVRLLCREHVKEVGLFVLNLHNMIRNNLFSFFNTPLYLLFLCLFFLSFHYRY